MNRAPQRRLPRIWGLVPVLLMLLLGANGNCGPSDREVGAGVAMTLPLAFAFSTVIMVLLARMWARRDPAVGLSRRTWLVGGLVTLGIAALQLIFTIAVADDPFEWMLFVIWIFGASYVTVSLVVYRLLMLRRPSSAPALAHLVTFVLLCLTPILRGFEVLVTAGGMTDAEEMLLIFPGYMGGPAVVVFLGLYLEAYLRTRKTPVAGPAVAHHFD